MMMTRVRNALKILNRLNDREMFILGCALENLVIMLHSKNNHGKMRVDERPDNGWRTLENDTHVQFDLESGEIIGGPEALVGAKFEKNEKGKTVAKKPDGSEVGWKGLKKGESGSNNGNESESNSKYKSKIKFTDNFFENRNALDALAAGTVIKVNGQTYEKSEDNFTEWINTETGELVYGIQIANSNYGAEVEVDKSKPEIAREKKEKKREEAQKEIDSTWQDRIDKTQKLNASHSNKNYELLRNAAEGRELYFTQDGKTHKFTKTGNGWQNAVTGENVTSYDMMYRLQGVEYGGYRGNKVIAGKAENIYFNDVNVKASASKSGSIIGLSVYDTAEKLKGAATGSTVTINKNGAIQHYDKQKDGTWRNREARYIDDYSDTELASRIPGANESDIEIAEDSKKDMKREAKKQEKNQIKLLGEKGLVLRSHRQ